jgi:hypothetical protein
MSDQKANEAFYKWEQSQYGNDSPLSDDDRILWVKGYKEGVMALFEYACNNMRGGV